MTLSSLSPEIRRRLALLAGLVLAVFTLVACQRCVSPTTAAGAPRDALEELDGVLSVSETALGLAGLACLFADDGDRCRADLGALEDAVAIGRALVKDGQACRKAQDQSCLSAALRSAGEQLPRVRRLLDLVHPGAAESVPTAAPSGSSAPGPSGPPVAAQGEVGGSPPAALEGAAGGGGEEPGAAGGPGAAGMAGGSL